MWMVIHVDHIPKWLQNATVSAVFCKGNMVLSRYKIKKHEELYGLWNPDASVGPSTPKKSKLEQTNYIQSVDIEDDSSDQDVKCYGHSSSVWEQMQCLSSLRWARGHFCINWGELVQALSTEYSSSKRFSWYISWDGLRIHSGLRVISIQSRFENGSRFGTNWNQFNTSWNRFVSRETISNSFHLCIAYDSYRLKECPPRRRKIMLVGNTMYLYGNDEINCCCCLKVSELFPLAECAELLLWNQPDSKGSQTSLMVEQIVQYRLAILSMDFRWVSNRIVTKRLVSNRPAQSAWVKVSVPSR